MLGGSSWRAAVASAQVALLIVALGCESGPPTAPTAPRETSPVPPIRRRVRGARLPAR